MLLFRRFLQILVQMVSNFQHFILPSVDSIYYSKQIARQRLNQWKETASGSPIVISTKHYLTYLYALIMSLRYLASGIALYTGYDRQYFSVDIVMYAIKERGNFDKITFVFCSLLLIYCCMVHYIRNYWTDYLIVSEQDKYVGHSLEQFWIDYPEFWVDLSSRNLPKIWIQLWRKVWKLNQHMNHLKRIGNEYQERMSNKVKLVKFNLIIEMINLWLYVVFSK